MQILHRTGHAACFSSSKRASVPQTPCCSLLSTQSRHLKPLQRDLKQVQPISHRRRFLGPAASRMSTVTVAAAARTKGELEVVTTNLSSTIRKLTITVPASMVQEGFNATVENLKKIVGDLQGFRAGKIPLSMLVTQCGGQRTFKLTIIEDILMKVMPMALNQLTEPMVPESERIASNINDLEATFDPAKPFTFEVEYETVPPIKWTRSYKEAEVQIRDTGNFATDSAAVDDLIRQFLKQKGFQRVVVGRGLERGDTCIMDIDMRSPGSKMSLPGMKKTKCPLDTELDPLGLVKGMLGMVVGEERKFTITFPSDYSMELWQGTEAEVTVKVHEVFYWVLPEFNDDFVKAHFSDKFESAEEMRKGLLASTAMERVKDLDRQLEDTLLDAVVSCMDVPEVPEKLVIEMGSTQYRNNLMRMMQNGGATKDDIEKLLTEENIEEYITKNRKDLEDMVKFNLAVDDIFTAEKLSVDEADIKAELEAQQKQYEAQKLEYDPNVLRDNVVENFKSVSVIEWLKDNCKRTVIPYEEPK